MFSEDTNLLVALIRSIYILDYATIYIAIDRGLDPSPTPAIDILKRIWPIPMSLVSVAIILGQLR